MRLSDGRTMYQPDEVAEACNVIKSVIRQKHVSSNYSSSHLCL